MKSGLNKYFEELLLRPAAKRMVSKATDQLTVTRNSLKRNNITLSQYFEKELLEVGSSVADETAEKSECSCEQTLIKNDADEEIDIYTSYASYMMSSSDPGSDNLLVTFDYGFEDSLDAADLSLRSQQLALLKNDDDLKNNLFKIPEEKSLEEELFMVQKKETHFKLSNTYKVHQVQSNININTRASSCKSLATSVIECSKCDDVSGDYGSWAQCESEPEEEQNNAKSYRNYRYEDLIKNEVLIYDDNDGNDDVVNGDDGKEVVIKFNFDEDIPPRWFNNNEQLYYRSVDYLN